MLDIKKLEGKLDPKLIKQRDMRGDSDDESGGGKKLSYLPGYVVESSLNKIANYIWSRRTLELTQLYVRNYKKRRKGEATEREMIEVAYSSKVEIEVKTTDNEVIVKHGIGFGNGQSSVNYPSAAYELAIKEAETDAFKRAAKSFGEMFGLELYDKDLDIVRSYETAKRSDDKYNEALGSVIASESEQEIKNIIKNYDGNYKSDLRESALTRVLELRNAKRETK